MTKGRDTIAENLGDVLELVRVRRQTGILSVERTQGARFEEGEIYIQDGQPIFARTGEMAGQEALIWLLSWHQVYFTFSTDRSLAPAASANNTSSTHKSFPVAINGVPPRLPGMSSSSTVPSPPSRLPQMSTSSVSQESRNISMPASIPFTPLLPLGTSPITPGLEWLVPRKVDKERDVLSLPLTRPQRCIYLLVDGHRTVADLARCVRKSLQEVERLLSELQDRGLIAV